MSEHPMQPVERDEHGVIRFKKNAVVEYLLGQPPNLNRLWMEKHAGRFSIEDMEQLYQLIGYSVSGFGDIDGFRTYIVELADRAAEALIAKEDDEDADIAKRRKRLKEIEHEVEGLRENLKTAQAVVEDQRKEIEVLRREVRDLYQDRQKKRNFWRILFG